MTPPETLLGYHVVSTLKSGSGHATWKAVTDGASGFAVLKWLSDEPHLRSRAELGRLNRDVASAIGIQDSRLASYLHCDFDEHRLVVARAWVPGVTLAQDPRFAPGKATEDQLLDLLVSVLVALDALHVRGLVCRRLTPNNLHLLPSGEVALSDWSVRWPETEASRRGAVAPEVRGGADPDERSDLWSLGAILYELLSGQSLDTKSAVLLDGCDGRVRDVLSRLLAPEPRLRPCSARRALRDLERPIPTAPRSGVARRLPFLLGRDGELADLVTALDRLAQGRSDLVFVRGAEGLGKTRLLNEVARVACLRNLRVVRGAPAEPTALPLGAFAPCFDEIASDMLSWTSAERRETLQNDGRLLLEASTRFHQIPEFASLREPPRLSAEASRHRLVRAASRIIAAYTRRTPLVLLIDDLEACDPLSLELLRTLARSVTCSAAPGTPARLLVVTAFDPLHEGGRGVVASMVSALRIKGVAREITLKPLAPHEVRQVLQEILAPITPPVNFVARVLEETSSVPLQIENLLTWFDDVGVLSNDPLRWLSEWEVARAAPNPQPCSSIDDEDALSLILGRSEAGPSLPSTAAPVGLNLGRIGPEATRVAEVVALGGGGNHLEVLRESCGLKPVDFDAAVAKLMRCGALRETSPETIVLRHPVLAEAILSGLDASGRRAIHACIGAGVERLIGRLDERASLWLAYHFHEAGDIERSLLYLPLAARLLKERHAIHEALVMTKRFFRHLQALEPAERERHLGKRIQALQFTAEILTQIERRPEAILTYREMGSLAEHEGRERDLVCAWSGLARLSVEAGDFETSDDFARRVIELARRRNQPGEVASALAVVGLTAMRRGREDEAVWSLSSALKIYREQEVDPVGAARVLELIGDVYASRFKYQRAIAPYRSACEGYRSVDDRVGIAHCLDRLGRAHFVLGNSGRALAFHRESLRLQREADQPERIGATLDLMGDAYRVRGDIDKARANFKEALALKRELTDLRGSADTLLRLAHVELQTGQIEDAQALLDQALAVARRAGNQRAEAGILVRYSQARLLRDDRPRAIELASDGLTRSRGCGDWMMECRAQIVLARCLSGSAALEAAAEAVRVAAKVGSPGLSMRAHANRGDILSASGRDEEAFAEYCSALDHANALMSASGGVKSSGFLRRADVLASLSGARELVSRRFGAGARERYPVLAVTESAELVSA